MSAFDNASASFAGARHDHGACVTAALATAARLCAAPDFTPAMFWPPRKMSQRIGKPMFQVRLPPSMRSLPLTASRPRNPDRLKLG